jgi:hypothetical protein
MSLLEAKRRGIQTVVLNGFRESLEYVLSLSLSEITWVGEIKSYDGYSTYQCYESH